MNDDALSAALDYLPRWLEFQRRALDLPGIALAVAKDGEVVLEAALGAADLRSGETLTPRHRHRVASHSKTFTAAGILRLREAGRLGLDDAVSRHVGGLHEEVGATTLRQLLSHGAGVIRNGRDGNYFADLRPYPDAEEIATDLGQPLIIPAETRFKYSNHGYALLGQVIEAVTGASYADWIAREVMAAFGLKETAPDAPVPAGTPFARGHTLAMPAGRLTVPGDNPTGAYAAAAGFVSTAGDLARFFAGLSPEAGASPLSIASRRAMVHRQWRDPHGSIERHYGLGTICGSLGDWDWFGHSGAFQGYASRTSVVPSAGITVSILVNAISAPTDLLLEGTLHVLRTFARRGAPQAELRDWTGRWWNLFTAVDLLPAGDRVLVALPALGNPVGDAAEIAVKEPDRGRIAWAPGFGNHGEPAELVRGADGGVAELRLGGTRCLPEDRHAAELRARYGAG